MHVHPWDCRIGDNKRKHGQRDTELPNHPGARKKLSIGALHSGHSGPVAGSPKAPPLLLAQYAASWPQHPRQARWRHGAMQMSAGRSRHTGHTDPSPWLWLPLPSSGPCCSAGPGMPSADAVATLGAPSVLLPDVLLPSPSPPPLLLLLPWALPRSRSGGCCCCCPEGPACCWSLACRRAPASISVCSACCASAPRLLEGPACCAWRCRSWRRCSLQRQEDNTDWQESGRLTKLESPPTSPAPALAAAAAAAACLPARAPAEAAGESCTQARCSRVSCP